MAKRLIRMGVALDLDLRNSEYSRFMKKTKVTHREKTKAVQSGNSFLSKPQFAIEKTETKVKI